MIDRIQTPDTLKRRAALAFKAWDEARRDPLADRDEVAEAWERFVQVSEEIAAHRKPAAEGGPGEHA